MNWRAFIGILTLGAALPALAATAGQSAPNFTLVDTQGKTIQLSDFRGKYVVLEWTNPECPFVRNQYNTRNMQGLQESWALRGFIESVELGLHDSDEARRVDAGSRWRAEGGAHRPRQSGRQALPGQDDTAHVRDQSRRYDRLRGSDR